MTEKTAPQLEDMWVDLQETLIADEQGNVYFRLDSLCKLTKLDPDAEKAYCQSHAVLKGGLKEITVANESVWVLESDCLALWLLMIDTKNLASIWQRTFLHYQKEAKHLLNEALSGGYFSYHPGIDDLMKQDAPEVKQYRKSLVQVRRARNKLLFRAVQTETEERTK
mgnify:CR=1 FL=1